MTELGKLNQADDDFVAVLRSNLPDGCFVADSDAYLSEPRGIWTGQAGVVVAPASTQEVSKIVALANNARVPIIPYSGGTGLVGGQVAPNVASPIILSTHRMSSVRAIYPSENVLIAEAGATLHDARAAAENVDRLFPLMLASEGSCRIGGNLSTNAGGMNVLRYGNTRDLCLGIEAVLPDGTIFDGLKRLRKDNTGYDIRNLLIGAEGTLGIITAASLRLFAQPGQIKTGLVAVESPAQALDLLNLAREHAGEMVSIFELISGVGLDFVAETMPDVKRPWPKAPAWMVLIEIGAPKSVDANNIWTAFFLEAFERGLITDGIEAQSERQRDELINLRESIPEANKRIGSISSHDISLPLSEIAKFVADTPEKIAELGPMRINCFGHLGDGNLHFNVYPPAGEKKADWLHMRDRVARLVHDLTDELDGSFSAEHGVGRLKVDDLERYGDHGRLTAMRAIKKALDPNGIMNPGAVLKPASD